VSGIVKPVIGTPQSNNTGSYICSLSLA